MKKLGIVFDNHCELQVFECGECKRYVGIDTGYLVNEGESDLVFNCPFCKAEIDLSVIPQEEHVLTSREEAIDGIADALTIEEFKVIVELYKKFVNDQAIEVANEYIQTPFLNPRR